MNLAIFDLDGTLLTGDSDYLWGIFLADHGLVDATHYKIQNQQFYDQYQAGTLDIDEYQTFSLQALANNSMQRLKELHGHYMTDIIRPIITQSARDLVQKHHHRGDFTLIITATNRFITQAIADELAVHDIIATDPEIVDGEFSGKLAGIPCFQEGKVTRLNEWLVQHNFTLQDSWFYSDSINDRPLLELVSHAVAVDPDEKLSQLALDKNWPIISLRD